MALSAQRRDLARLGALLDDAREALDRLSAQPAELAGGQAVARETESVSHLLSEARAITDRLKRRNP